MSKKRAQNKILTDGLGRFHNYLRISLTERCNLRCTYCMPEHGIPLSPKENIMTYEEVHAIAKRFVDYGVTKIRLTGGEPLIRKDVGLIMELLGKLPVELSITTNGVIVDRFVEVFKKAGIKKINISLDSLNPEKNHEITRRNYFKRVWKNILLLHNLGFEVKINCVLIKGFNDDEIIDFIDLGKKRNLNVRFIEFMPFSGNKWDLASMVSLDDILKRIGGVFKPQEVMKLKDEKNDTTKNYKIKGYKGCFGIISSVSNPFCGGCNRIRLTANGCIKNCLFSASESDLLQAYRQGNPLEPIIEKTLGLKKAVRNGMFSLEKFKETAAHQKNRSMIAIGG